MIRFRSLIFVDFTDNCPNLKKDFENVVELSDLFRTGIEACLLDIHSFNELPETERKQNIADSLHCFGEHLENIAKDMLLTASKFRSIKITNDSKENRNLIENENNKLVGYEGKSTNGDMNDSLLNQKSKERWLASSSDEDSDPDESSSPEISGLVANKKTNDLSLSQINGFDDEDDTILIKNEPILTESHQSIEKSFTANVDSKTKEKELSKWNDLDDNMDEEDDFHGFSDDIEDDRINESIEIHVKSEQIASENGASQLMDSNEQPIQDVSKNSVDANTSENVADETSHQPEDINDNVENENCSQESAESNQLEQLENGAESRSEDESVTSDKKAESGDEDDREISR